MRTLHVADNRADIVRRVQLLTPRSQRLWGRMAVDQMLWHVNGMLRISIGELPFVPSENIVTRTVVRFFAFNMPWPKGRAPTAPEVKANGNYDFELEQAALFDLLERFAAKDLQTPWPRHPAFGAMTGHDWSRLEHKHVDHHLRQFGA